MNLSVCGFLALTLALIASGCTYRGAVYSEYTTAGIDIRANAASESPVKVSFGYDRGVAALVPRRNSGTNGSPGEAVSLVSWSNLGATFATGTTNSVLSVDAGFITGTAAEVIAAPSNATVVIRGPGNVTNAMVLVDGSSAGQRIASAITMEGNYGADVNTELLRRFWKPDGKTPDGRNRASINQFLIENGQPDLPITLFLYSKEYRDLRIEAARTFGLTP